VRRNKGRFWEGEPGQSKLAAYQTLYSVLVTLTKLFAPIVPLLSEKMYRNLVEGPEDRSVHLVDYPAVDEPLIDEELSKDMEALLRVKAVGSAARNAVKMKVRQPLAEMKVQPGDEREGRAVRRFGHLLCDELNIKKVTLHEGNGSLLRLEVRPNPKTLGSRGLGPRLKDVQQALAAADQAALAAKLQAGETVELACAGGPIALALADVFISTSAPEPWAGVADKATQVVVDTRVTEELKREGQAREISRHVNEARKQAGLNIEDRIVLYLGTDSAELRQTIEAHSAYIGGETLVKEWSSQPLGGNAYKTTVKVDGQPLTIELRKAI
jgi:isoleucyl-tRNA synthetase